MGFKSWGYADFSGYPARWTISVTLIETDEDVFSWQFPFADVSEFNQRLNDVFADLERTWIMMGRRIYF